MGFCPLCGVARGSGFARAGTRFARQWFGYCRLLPPLAAYFLEKLKNPATDASPAPFLTASAIGETRK
jgi:hypothetical protein